MTDEPASAVAAPADSPAAAAAAVASPSSPPASQPNTVVVTSIDPVIQLPQLEEIFSAIGQLASIRWFDAPASRERVCLLEYGDEAQASSALIISDMHIMLGSKEIAVRKWDGWWQQQVEEVARQKEQQQQQQQAVAAATATHSASSAISATLSSVLSLSDPASIASAALAAAQLAQSLSNPAASLYPASTFDPNLSTIYVGNLAPPVTEEILTAYFSQVGPLAAVRLQADGTSPNRFAFVEFVEVEKANAALALHGQLLLNRPMKVGKASTPITNRALLGVTTPGGPVLSEAERVARMQLAGNVSGDRVAAALARVAQAQQLIANKLGVPVQVPITASLPALTAVLPPTVAAVSAVAGAALKVDGGKESSVERKHSSSRSRSRSSERHRRRRRSHSHSRSRSASVSRSRSPSHSRSRSRSPAQRQRNVRRWSRERDRGRRRDRRRPRDFSEERRDRRHGRKRSYSRSPSPRQERKASVEHEKKDDMDVGSDRWRAAGADAEHAADERKDDVQKDERRGRENTRERDSDRDRDRYRDDRRRGDKERDRERSRSRERYRGRDNRQHPPRHGRRRYSSDSGDEEFVHRRARDNAGQRNRYKKNPAGREGLQWDGYQWVSTTPHMLPLITSS